MTSWLLLQQQILNCQNCALRGGASTVVFGRGIENASIMVIGEAPGAEEDRLGLPFVGRSGRLLMKLFEESGFHTDQLFITNTVKCRPPSNRTPRKKETSLCRPWLDAQIEALAPQVIVTVGNVPSQTILATREGITTLRGHFHQASVAGLAVTVRPLFHPAYLLRNPSRGDGAPTDLTLHDLADLRRFINDRTKP